MNLAINPSVDPSRYQKILPPLRGEAFSAEHLDVHFRTLAESQVLRPVSQAAGRDFSARFEANAVQIAVAHQVVTKAARAGDYLPSEAEWLLDNYYVVEEQLREIRDDLPRGFYQELPKTNSGHPRVYELARELVVHTDSSLDGQMVERCVREFQSVAPLSIGEVWAIPIMLRLVLVENLRRLCDQMLLTFRCRRCAHEMLDAWRADRGFQIEDETEHHCVPTIIQLIEQLPARGPSYRQAVSILERQVTERGWQLPELVRQEHQRQAANQVSIGNVITSMRLIASLDWSSFFEQVNLVEQILRQDPANVYARMHFETRDEYRHVVEELAKRTKRPDTEIATAAVALAQAHQLSSSPTLSRQSHVGYWLIDRGRRQLEQRVGYRTPPSQLLRYSMLRWPLLAYFGSLAVFTTLGVVSILWLMEHFDAPRWTVWILGCLWILPASELAQSLNNLLVTNVLPPRLLPRFDFKDGVPLSYPTIIVVPSMLSHGQEVASLLHRLESHYLSNSDEALLFALLTDYTDAASEVTPHDAELLEQAMLGIRQLNERYATPSRRPFYLFHRRRQWNAAEAVWMGWERKRGKLMEFGRLLQGGRETSYVVQEGDLAALHRFHSDQYTPFVITLDSDTQLPHDVARKLIGTLAHPLNRPQFGPDRTTVTAGYTILQPRVNVHLESAGRSWFAKIFSASPGVDPYATAASDVYQDLFGEGSFTGKGIYDLQAFERALEGAFPENSILSHDLIEGCHARVGLVSNIEVYDGYPARYDAESRRTHRWVRGDWQLLPWLLPRVPYATGWKRNPLSILSRWKVTDNLRRSLVAPALLSALIIGWCSVPQGAVAWSLAGLFVLLFPLFAQITMIVRHWPWKLNFLEHLRAVAFDVTKTLAQCLLAVVVLPHKAWAMIDAIGRTLFRMGISRRHLLEWETAAAVERRVSHSRWSLLKELWVLPTAAVLVGAILPWSAVIAALPFLLLWFAGPAIIFAINQPIRLDRSVITPEQENWLRQFVSETWSFFEAYVGPEDHWLPVDNVQEEPHEKIAHRLSPTNEGLFLLSALIARDFGYVGLHRLVTLWENNLESVERLEKLKGHLFNWYDTETLAPLVPRYVSTVDSGNLAACLLTLHAGIEELIQQQAMPMQGLRGLQETLHLLITACDEIPTEDTRQSRDEIDAIRRVAEELLKSISLPRKSSGGASSSPQPVPLTVEEWSGTLDQVRNVLPLLSMKFVQKNISEGSRRFLRKLKLVRERLESLCEDFENLYGWVPLVQQQPPLRKLLDVQLSLEELASLDVSWRTKLSESTPNEREASRAATVEEPFDALQGAFHRAAQGAKQLLARMKAVACQVEAMALSMDFCFLYNEQRRLFSIGYNVDEGRLDRSHYDMLCSEARLASYLAIAKGDVEATHWFRLGRHATIAAGKFALLSWGGTMFEYLMPPLFHRQFDGALLTQSCHAAVLRQQEYGRQNKIPWGISESAYGALAINSDYHYRSFGVPGLGLKRGLARDLVVSPYSTLMALPIDPAGAVANLHALIEAGAEGFWGFYDALDFTPERVPVNKRRIVVRCYMAHHQGMSLLGLANLLDQGSIQRRFNSHPIARAAELLLQERVPTVMTPYEPHADEVEPVAQLTEEQQLTSRRLTGVESAIPRTHLLSNGAYSVMLTSAGGGFSRSGAMDVTRWRSDTTVDGWGQFIYLRDLDADRVWSPTYQPTCVAPDHYEVIFAIDKVDFHRIQGDLETVLEVAVSPENNAEVRQLRVTNHGTKLKRLQVTSYAEVSLATAAADRAHPAFQKLFLETEFIKDEAALIARRRPRDVEQPATFAVHVLAVSNEGVGEIEYDTSRQAFLGRRRSVGSPQAIDENHLSGTTGAVLDPIFSLRCTLSIPPGESVVIAFTTAVAASRDEALVLIDQYHELRNVQRVFELAWAYAQVELRHQHLTPGQVHLYQKIASYLLYPHRCLRGEEALMRQNRLGQSGLWRHGISGDLPILLARVTEAEHVGFVRELALAQRFWRERGFRVDLVIINDYPGSYFDALQEQMVSLMQEINRSADHPGVYLLRGAHLPQDEIALFETVASAVLHGDRGPIPQQLEYANQIAGAQVIYAKHRSIVRKRSQTFRLRLEAGEEPVDLEFWNGTGGFAQSGKEYQIRVRDQTLPPMPWSQVVANENLGFLVTECGGGYTWFQNSRENKLTTWSNDPITDPPSEVLYVQDRATGEILMPMSHRHQPNETAISEVWARYGAGYATFTSQDSLRLHEVTLSVAQEDPVKFIRYRITNKGNETKSFLVSYYAELVLGVNREQTLLHLNTGFDEETQAVLCRNPYHPEYSQQVVFLKSMVPTRSYTTDRSEFLGRYGDWESPEGLRRSELKRTTGVGLDSCAVVQTQVEVGPNETREVIFLLGAGNDEAHAKSLLGKYPQFDRVHQAETEALAGWREVLDQVQVKTPNRGLDLLVNNWLLYQVLGCRMWGRSAFYQSGGAFGFRDQLQDSMALVYSRPDLVREHLLRAASRQYRQGDVQHWWHPPLGKGTRTKFSDDLLWMPFAVCHYADVTKDLSVLDEIVSFLDSPVLQPDEHERYEQPRVSQESGSLYEHCLRAMDRGMQFGSHGLPLMGCGDWNDGMNKVGEGGRGESVWVGWFLLVLLDRFIPLMRARGDVEKARDYEATAEKLRASMEAETWDGGWYRRAYFDDGTPLGSAQNDECKIDSLAQTWAVFAQADAARARQGVDAAVSQLVNREIGIVLLFAPPFDHGVMNPGYIKGYLPGIRENGGQYTHAATWLIQALAQLGERDQAMSIFDLINPIRHTEDAAGVARYQTEPYVIAADVYGVPPHEGRGGWTWYTGSAAWLYRVALEQLLGVTIRGDEITLNPAVPDDWDEFEVTVNQRVFRWNRPSQNASP